MKFEHYSAAINAELQFSNPIAEGSNGLPARRVQEWLGYHRCRTGIDGDYGSATTAAVKKFQLANAFDVTGQVDHATWQALTMPMREVLQDGTGDTLSERVGSIAQRHLQARPIELGGANGGPWVRMYTGGHDGVQWAWCAGFVTSILRQACIELEQSMPIKGSLSCDTLAAQGLATKRLVEECELESGKRNWDELGSAYIFLVRRTPGDWTHTGLGFGGSRLSFGTVEGNSNSEGSSDGYEVANLMRSYKKKDFILLN